LTGFAVAAYITGAHRFAASTSFANPAVTMAWAFADIRSADEFGFILAQLAGTLLALPLLRHPAA
jgi:glycerol uptake facilitator-like aquaporin